MKLYLIRFAFPYWSVCVRQMATSQYEGLCVCVDVRLNLVVIMFNENFWKIGML